MPGDFYNWSPVLWAVLSLVVPALVQSGPGTTPNIQQIFLGRCFEYQELSRGRLLLPNLAVNCSKLWDLFEQAWVHKDPKTITLTDYEEFFDAAAQQDSPKDKVLLWSGTFDIAHEYANDGKRYVTLEDTLLGYTANGITWCGRECSICDGINHVACPNFTDLPKEASEAFWGGASSTFARYARGSVNLMLNGTRQDRPAYSRDSFFSKFELPSLPEDASLNVILVNDLDQVPREHCETGSLLDLKFDVEARGLSYSCEENPTDIVHLLCVGSSNSKCEVLRQTFKDQDLKLGRKKRRTLLNILKAWQ